MTITSPVIILTMGDAVLSAVASPDVHSRTDIDDLVTGEAIRGLNYITYEPNGGWILDGSKHFAPDPGHLGFVSDTISLVDKSFTSDPVLTLTLDAVVDIEQGITLEFSDVSGDYPTALNIEYQDAATAAIDDDDYIPIGYNFFAEAPTPPIADVKYIVITFSETNEAYRHIKLLEVYADGILFDKSNIQSSNTIEQIDPTSSELPSNELNFSVYNDDGDFSIVNPQGIYAGLEENQRVDAYEFVDDSRIFMGRFYLKNWNSVNENLAKFECVDFISLSTTMAPSTLSAGEYVYVISAGFGLELAITLDNFINFLRDGLGIDYDLDASLTSNAVTGFIDAKISLRDALQLTGFGEMAFITCSRSKDLRIVPSVLVDNVSTWDYTFSTADIGQKPKITLKPIVTGINLVAHSYPVNNEHVDFQVYDDSVVNGVYFVYFPSDYYGDGTWTKTGTSTATITDIGVRYLEFTVTNAGTINIISTNSRIHSSVSYQKLMSGLPASFPRNDLEIKDATLVTPDNADSVLDFVYDYFQQRHVCEFKLFASAVEPGDAVKVPVQGQVFGGIVEKIESDLSGGFVQKITAVGNIL